jgi:uncharacterized protein YndB with AHSA1/START domain/DNA-binding transcriptional ArsR family regulator
VAHDPLLAAVLEPRRRAILRVLAEEALPVGRLAERFEVTRPAISQHLAVLRAAGLVETRTEGGRGVSRVRSERVAAAARALGELAAELPGVEVPEGESAAGAAGAAGAGEPPEPPELAVALLAAAPPGRLFALATTPDGLARWLGRATVDLRPGGRYRVDLGGDAAAGTYSVVDPPHRVVFGWGQEGGPLAPDSSTVEIRLSAAEGGTLVSLEQRGLPPEARAPHLGSWATHLPRLVLAARVEA